jgi:glycosyltransferase involved in cell wall biosynthesis
VQTLANLSAPVARAMSIVGGLMTATGLFSASGHARVRTAAQPEVEPLSDDELISVVVCTMGRRPRLKDTVRAVLGQTHEHTELLVVDNDPGSGRAAALLQEFDDPRLSLVPQPVRGLSAARNAGLARARGGVVAYTDDDIVPDPTWLECLLAVFRRDTAGVAMCVTGRVLGAAAETEEQAWFEQGGLFDKGETATVWSLVPLPHNELGTPGIPSVFFPYSAEMGAGGNMAFRTHALRALGGFDEALGAGTPAKGGEDLDIFRRVLVDGHVIAYTPDAVVRHHHRDTYAALRQQMFDYGVGMAAVLTKLLLLGGRPALDVLRLIPRGIFAQLSPRSAKNIKKPAEMPRVLLYVELLGSLVGPVLYLYSAAVTRRRRTGAGPASSG